MRRKKKPSTAKKLGKGLQEESKATALTVDLSHRQKRRMTNCSQEDTLVSQMDTAGCQRVLKLTHSSAIKASTLDTLMQTSLFADHTVDLSS